MWTKEQIIYLAAIIDGEGSICIDIQKANSYSRKFDYYSIRLLVINTSLPLINWLQENFKGNVTKRKLIPNRRQCYKWQVYSHDACAILEDCLPYMIVKKHHAEILIEFMKTKDKGIWNITSEIQAHRKILYDRLKNINKNPD